MGRKLNRRRLDEIYEYVCDYKRKHNGISPSVRDIRTAVGVASTSTVNYHLRVLEAQGRIRMPYGVVRGIEIPGSVWRMSDDVESC